MGAVNKSGNQRGRPFRPGVSGNARGRPKGARNKRTRILLEAAEAGGEMPLDFLLRLMRDPRAPTTRRLEAAKAAAPFAHPRLSPVEPKPIANLDTSDRVSSVEVRFVKPRPGPDGDDV
jgi:hypothetical protein